MAVVMAVALFSLWFLLKVFYVLGGKLRALWLCLGLWLWLWLRLWCGCWLVKVAVAVSVWTVGVVVGEAVRLCVFGAVERRTKGRGRLQME